MPGKVVFYRNLAFLQPYVNRGNACSNLCEEYHERFQLIHHEYSSISHFCADFQYFHNLLKLMIPASLMLARSSPKHMCHSIHLRFLRCHIKTCLIKHSCPREYVSEGDLYSKTQNFMFAHCCVANIFKFDGPTIHKNKQLTHNDNNA
jgi:hypothetical protein